MAGLLRQLGDKTKMADLKAGMRQNVATLKSILSYKGNCKKFRKSEKEFRNA